MYISFISLGILNTKNKEGRSEQGIVISTFSKFRFSYDNFIHAYYSKIKNFEFRKSEIS